MVRKTNQEALLVPGRCTLVVMCVAAWLVCPTWSYGQSESPESSGNKAAGQRPYLTCTPPLSEADRKVFVALHKTYTVDFDRTPLTEVADVLANLTGERVVVDSAALTRERVNSNTSIAAKHEDSALESIFWQILPKHRLDYCVKNGAVHITTRTFCCSHPVTWTYSVEDLCRTESEFKQLLRVIESMTPESEWDAFGGFAKLSPNQKNRRFTLTHAQSDQDKVLRCLIDKRRAAKVSTEK
jgi:hypothetical protein